MLCHQTVVTLPGTLERVVAQALLQHHACLSQHVIHICASNAI